MPKKILAVIPARGGSKGVPHKNIKRLNGKPLISYTIAEALNNLGFDDIDLVRIGKYIEITLESKNKKTAEGIVKKMCETLLVNLVIESYDVEIDPYIAK